MATDAEIAWCAGFFDGEGHVSYKRSYPSEASSRVSPLMMCNVSQASTNLEVLVYFEAVVGMGKIKGPYKMQNGRDQHRLIFGVREVEPLFIMLKPHLRSEKTGDFQRALLGYWTHDSNPTMDDWTRYTAWKMKKEL